MTDIPIPKDIEKLLQQGTKFIPDVQTITSHNINLAFEECQYTASIKHLFNIHKLQSENTEDPLMFFTPSNDREWLEEYKNDLYHLRCRFQEAKESCIKGHNILDISKIQILRDSIRHNTHKQVLQKLKTFMMENKLIISPSDKNLGFTIFHRNVIHALTLSQLQNYTKISLDNLPSTAMFDDVILEAKNLLHQDKYINKQIQNFIERSMDKTRSIYSTFYILPKIHKNPVQGRPITSARNHILQPISKILVHILQQKVWNLPTVLKNSTQLINEISQIHLPQNATIITADINALYPSIPWDGIYVSMEWFLSKYDFKEKTRYIIMKIIKLILEFTYVKYTDQYFKQETGCAMGNALSPIIANVYMAYIEYRAAEQIPFQENHIIYYRRYLDDIFIINTIEDTSKVQALFNHMTEQSTGNITFVWKQDLEVPFLDIFIYIQNDHLKTKPYSKPMNAFAYITPSSTHPQYMPKNMVKGELIRLVRLSSERQDYCLAKKSYIQRLINRGYQHKLIIEWSKQVNYNSRSLYLQEKNTNDQSKGQNVARFKMSFSNHVKYRRVEAFFRTEFQPKFEEDYYIKLHWVRLMQPHLFRHLMSQNNQLLDEFATTSLHV